MKGVKMKIDELLGEEINDFVSATKITRTTPFPQANSLDRVLAVVGLMTPRGIGKSDLLDLGIVNSIRQADYYMNAAVYLGLAKPMGARFYPTGLAKRLQMTAGEERLAFMAAIALAHPVVGEVYANVFLLQTKEERKRYIASVVDMGASARAESTCQRRADGLYSWLIWIQRHLPAL